MRAPQNQRKEAWRNADPNPPTADEAADADGPGEEAGLDGIGRLAFLTSVKDKEGWKTGQ